VPTDPAMVAPSRRPASVLKKKKSSKGAPLVGKVNDLLPPSLDLSALSGGDADLINKDEKSDDDDDVPPKKLVREVVKASAKDESDDEDDDAPPEEVSNKMMAPELMLPKVEEEASRAKRPRPLKKIKSEGDVDKAFSAGDETGGYIWEDPQNREMLEILRDRDSRRQQRKLAGACVTKHGFQLQRADAAAFHESSNANAAEFLQNELFANRIRKRSLENLKDRGGAGDHYRCRRK